VPEDPSRLRFVRSSTAKATWVFDIEDHAQSSYFFVDGRPRSDGCTRRGRILNCQLRGLFPGGHTVELRLPGALLRRSALIGKDWPVRVVAARAAAQPDIELAAMNKLDAVVLDAAEPRDLILAAHKKGLRVIVDGDGALKWIELAGADAVVGVALPKDVAKRFPDARALPALRAPPNVQDFAVALVEPGDLVAPQAALPIVEALSRTQAFRKAKSTEIQLEAGLTRVMFREDETVAEIWINTSAVERELPPAARVLYIPGQATAQRRLAASSAAVIERGAKESGDRQY
jgi:hypothetical protein